jgi:cytochrome c biogenesis protein CcmG, thiol:disulfide interchange protein DsbE
MTHTGSLSLLLSPRRFATLILVVVVFGGCWMAGSLLSPDQPAAKAGPSAQVGFAAPEFALPSSTSATASLSAQSGKVVMINLWASWCPPCRAEMPAVQNVYVKYRDAGFVVLAVNVTNQDDESAALAFARSLGLTFPILFDRSGTASRDYRLNSLPTSYFVGRDGVIREIVIGGATQAAIESRVKRLLSGGS